MAVKFAPLQAFADEVRAAGFKTGFTARSGCASPGARAGARYLRRIREGYLDLASLASTDADTVLAQAERVDAETLFVVADKTGGALETLSLSRFFYTHIADTLTNDAPTDDAGAEPGNRFVAVCNPDDPLAAEAAAHGFRATFHNDAGVPGCYAALSLCGLLPAALAGVSLSALQAPARAGAAACGADRAPEDNAGVWLGTVLAVLARAGRDKATFVLPGLAGLGGWLERLLAEATGKDGVGILPVVGEPLGTPEVYGDDRVFVHLHLADDRYLRGSTGAARGGGATGPAPDAAAQG